MIKYSVVIPVYNLENYISKTLDSLANRPDDTEIIIINDGSTDKSWTILEEYISKHDVTDIQLLKEPNSGVSIARNTGIEAARGEYLIFIDGDDICSDDIFEKIEARTDTESDMIVWRFETDDGKNKKESQSEFKQEEYSAAEFCKSLLSGENRIRIGSFAVRKDLIIEKNLRFTEDCAICEDVEFMYKAVLSSDKIMTVIIQYLGDYVSIAFRICLPVVATIMLTNAVLGILVKTAPQINMFSVGIQIKLFIGLAALMITIGVLPSASEYIFREMKVMMTAMVRSLT